MVLQSWIIDSLKMYEISDKVIKFSMEAMKNWKVELTGERTLAEVNIQGGIFQGDALSLILFLIAMIPFNPSLRKCTEG